MCEMQRTIGHEAGASCVAMSRSGGRVPVLSSLSYLSIDVKRTHKHMSMALRTDIKAVSSPQSSTIFSWLGSSRFAGQERPYQRASTRSMPNDCLPSLASLPYSPVVEALVTQPWVQVEPLMGFAIARWRVGLVKLCGMNNTEQFEGLFDQVRWRICNTLNR